MRWTAFLCALVISPGSLTADGKKEPPAPAVRPLDVKVEGPARGKLTEPTVIASADDLAQAIRDESTAAAIRKLVDFGAEKVLYFAWSGSGQDRVALPESDGGKGSEIIFTYTPGRTRDLRPHHKLFALPKDAKYKVVTAGR